jgi:hypothetical protein
MTVSDGEENFSDRQKKLFFILGFLFFTVMFFIVFSPVLKVGLLSDDWGEVVSNKIPWKAFTGHWATGQKGMFYRPLSRLLLFCERNLLSNSGVAQHWLSLLLTAGATSWLALALFRRYGVTASFIATGCFLLNPNITEAVSWISSQTDLLVGFFYMGSLFFLLPPLSTKKILLSAVFALLAYCSKDSAISLGITVIACAGYVLFVGAVNNTPQRKNLILAMGIHGGLWISYMIARRIFLGQFGLPEQRHFAPAFGFLHHITLNLASVLHQYFLPFFEWTGDRGFLVERGASLLWLPLVMMVLAIWAFLLRRHDLVVIFIAWVLAILPAITAEHQFFYKGFIGSARYLYLGLFFFSALVGAVLHLLWKDLKRGARIAAVVLLAIVATHMSFRVAAGVDDWVRCAAVRSKLEEELRSACRQHPNLIIVTKALPNNLGEGYVFRNGFSEFFSERVLASLPGMSTISARNILAGDEGTIRLKDLQTGRPIFRINYERENAAMVTRAQDLERLSATLAERKRRIAKPVAWFWDFSAGKLPNVPLSRSNDVLSMKLPGEQAWPSPPPVAALLLEIRRGDPFIGFALPGGVDQVAFGRAVIEFELLDIPEGREKKYEVLEIIWRPEGPTETFPSLQAEFAVAPGIQKIDFPLENNVQWVSPEHIRWARFDLGDYYTGRVRIYRMGLLP